ncbi:endolytic transglycosylase MltG [Desulfolithobacter sp.]
MGRRIQNKLLFLAPCFLLLIFLVICGWFWRYAVTPAPGKGEVVVYIPRGAGVREIASLLAGQGLVPGDFRFLLLARLTGSAGKLQAGEFCIPYGLTPLKILQLLEEGRQVMHRVTIPEGKTVYQVADILAGPGWVEQERFLALSRNRDFISSLGLDVASLEGYLFPDTYTLVRGIDDAPAILRRMVARFEEVWQEIQASPLPVDPQSKALSRHEVVTLASIVEKETAEPTERPLIARVFLNRLKRNMRLQADPTVTYGLDNVRGPITRADLRRRTPYNTYVISGLPPGPICNPGRAALEAVLHPAKGDVLYFVSRNDGTHQFSRTLQEHNRAVRAYRKAIKRGTKTGQTGQQQDKKKSG